MGMRHVCRRERCYPSPLAGVGQVIFKTCPTQIHDFDLGVVCIITQVSQMRALLISQMESVIMNISNVKIIQEK